MTIAAVLMAVGMAVLPADAQQKAANEGDRKLRIGDPAPPLKQGVYLKGEPVKGYEKGTVYVIEFWATWCAPCVKAIPHLTELQDEYGDKVVIIGQTVSERQNEKIVKSFVTKMGDRMNYRVAMDDNSEIPAGYMTASFRKASGHMALPLSVIVDQEGRVAWLGHPGGLVYGLKKIVGGSGETD
ncbi:TlpA family protein disulfide reductase [Haloferula chungangensis]|uniref:TlpA family protein disulfide reductase n=1 Tax=Haloferula chungangensis TaxID=1048331 RepID=A0ABW2L3D3_9BACT